MRIEALEHIQKGIKFGEILSHDPKSALKMRYGEEVYPKFKHDSPSISRASLVDRAHTHLRHLEQGDAVLDVGGGPQTFAWEYFIRYGTFDFTIHTVDNAPIAQDRLLLDAFSTVRQHTVDADRLPFPDSSIAVGVSNIALDFAMAVSEDREKPIAELSRVLRPNAPLVLNLNHPSMVPPNIEERLAGHSFGHSERGTLLLWQFMAPGLFQNPEQIRTMLQKHGFGVEKIHEAPNDRQGSDFRWEVDAIRVAS